MKYMLSFLVFLSIATLSKAQEKFTISGYVEDSESGEGMVGSYVYDLKSQSATTTNVYGFYSMTLPKDSVELVFSYIGYQTQAKSFYLTEDLSLKIALSPGTELNEAVVESSQKEAIQNQTQMSIIDLDMKKVQDLPVLLGETDLLKTLQLLPGVQSGTEGASGIYVRGGGPDQNLMLLDGVPVYNASHLFGFFSVFNADAIRDVQLVKGGFPARYGGRLSSVIDVRMKEGNLYETHGEGSIGIVAAKATVEGPIKKGKSSFLFSGRRTYIDLLARPLIANAARSSGDTGTGGYFFYDLNGKLNYILNDKNRVFLSGYFGNDKAFVRYSSNFEEREENFDSKLEWGNAILAARWNHVYSPKLFSNTTFTYSKYKFFTSIGVESKENEGFSENIEFGYNSGIDDWSAKIDFDYLPNPKANIKFGASYVYHTFTPGVSQVKVDVDDFALDTLFGSDKIYGNEVNVFGELDLKVNPRFNANLGVHSSNFFVEGESYYSFQPRASLRYLINDKLAAKASYANMTQFLHLLSNSGIDLPTDLWVPVTKRIKPQISDQVALGAAMTPKSGYEISVEGYYKWMQNLIEYKDGANFQGTAENWQDKVEVGKGWSYGVELLLEKNTGKFTGWIGYTLSWANRKFENVNFGDPFPFRFDRRHDLGIAATYKASEKWDVGFVYVYGTGNAVTLPVARYSSLGPVPTAFGDSFGVPDTEYITERNGYRMPSYHRFDIGFNLHKNTSWGERTWSLGVYNIYNRQNPFFLFFDSEFNSQTNESQTVLKQFSLFPIIPSITYKFKF